MGGKIGIWNPGLPSSWAFWMASEYFCAIIDAVCELTPFICPRR